MNRHFRGVWIPASIYLIEDLSWTEKILLIEIDSLDKKDYRGCFASNETLAKHLKVTPGALANIISKLKKMGLIEQCWFDGRSRGLRWTPLAEQLKIDHSYEDESSLHKNIIEPSSKHESSLHKKVSQPSYFYEHTNTERETVRDTERETKRTREKNGNVVDLFENTITPKSQEKKERENVPPKRERKQPDLVLPWDTETFKAIWEKWCDYRWHEHKFRYKSQHSEQAALKQLAEKCKNEAEATQAVYRSMSQGWKGIFPEVANAQTAASNPITNARRKTKYTNTRGEEI